MDFRFFTFPSHYMSQVEQFYILAHMGISAIGGLLLLAIWYNIKTRYRKLLVEDDSQQRVDKGLAYLSSALFMWVVAGAWTLLHKTTGLASEQWYYVGLSLCSTGNNLFFLLAISYSAHAPDFLRQHPKNVLRFTILILLVAGSSIVLFLGLPEDASGSWRMLGNLPDVLLSGLLSLLLMYILYQTFQHRKLTLVAIISVATILLMLASQLPEVIPALDNPFVSNLLRLVAKTSLISIFLVLATTWVIQLASTPTTSEIAIEFHDWGLVKLTIPSKNILGQTLDFGSKTTQYRNLLKFAIRRKCGKGESQCIVVGSGGELKSQTYLSRIIVNLNDILQPEEENRLDRKDLFTFIGQGQYRLRVLPENIRVEPNLLTEFTNEAEDAQYSELVTDCNNNHES